MPTGLIHEQDSMSTLRDGLRYLGQMQGHGGVVAEWQDKTRAVALFGADGAEGIGRGRTLVVRRAGAGATPSPAARDLVFLADAGLVLEPDHYLGAGGLPALEYRWRASDR
jgi:hypothetical protein